MKINDRIKTQLQSKGIYEGEAYLYLLAIHFGLNVRCIPDEIIKKVNLAGIVERSFNNGTTTISWKIPLFNNPVDNIVTATPVEQPWEWVNEWRDLFKRVNPDRNGVKSYCISRMKKFFQKFPEYRKDDVMNATKAYLRTVSEPMYCKTAHKFIFEDSGSNQYSHLLEWCERNKENGYKPKSTTFKRMGD